MPAVSQQSDLNQNCWNLLVIFLPQFINSINLLLISIGPSVRGGKKVIPLEEQIVFLYMAAQQQHFVNCALEDAEERVLKQCDVSWMNSKISTEFQINKKNVYYLGTIGAARNHGQV